MRTPRRATSFKGIYWLFAAGLAFALPSLASAQVIYAANFYDYTGYAISKVAADGSVTGFVDDSMVAGPYGLAKGSGGDIFVAAYDSNAIFKITAAGVVSRYDTGGLYHPSGLVINAAGELFTTSLEDATVSKIDQHGNVTVFATGGGISNPQSLAINSAGELFVTNSTDSSDGHGGVIHGNSITKVETDGSASIFSPTNDAFGFPTGIAFNSKGDLYAVSYVDNTLLSIDSSGTVTPVTLTNGELLHGGLTGLTFDDQDDFLIATDDNRILEVTPGGVVSLLTSNDSPGADLATFHGPAAMLYVSASAVPEPATYAAIVGGLALVGAMVRRRRKTV